MTTTHRTSSNTTTSSNNSSATSNQQQDVVDLLRDKIRCNALDLLERVDASRRARNNNNNNNNAATTSTPPSSTRIAPTIPGTSTSVGTSYAASMTPTTVFHATVTSTTNLTKREEDEEEKKDSLEPSPTSTSLKPSSSTIDLTKRLQQLALQRQEQQHQTSLRIIQSGDTHLTSAQTFEELLPPHLLQSVYEMGFNRPSAIQSATVPLIIHQRNVIAQAQSGSGKTVAFTLGVLLRIQTNVPQTQALVVTPTRELAIQVMEQAVVPLSTHLPGFTSQLAISGSQVEGKVNAHVVVGTPGKVTDWLKRRIIDARTVRVFVLDEADAMVDGFRAKSLLIFKQLPKPTQCLFFSATFPPLVVDFASKLVRNPDMVLIDNDEELVLEVIKQLWVDTRQYPGGKIMFLADIYTLMTIGQSIVFVETRHEADQVYETLNSAGYLVSVLHSNLEPHERDQTMQDFRHGRSSVLITTNVLARGANVDNVCLVINYSLPLDKFGCGDYETYLHRIGRTGRFGKRGTAVSFIDSDPARQVLQQIQDHFGTTMHHVEADPEALANEVQI